MRAQVSVRRGGGLAGRGLVGGAAVAADPTRRDHKNERYCCFASFFTPGPQMVVSGSEDHMVYLWDIQSGKVVQQLRGHEGAPLRAGRGWGGGRSEKTGALTCPGTSDCVLAVAVNSAQSVLATGALESDKFIRLWAAGSG